MSLTGVVLLACAASATAQVLPEAVRACSRLRNDSERLACYDRAVEAFERQEGEISAASPEEMFGVPQRTTPMPSRDEREQLAAIVSEVVSVSEVTDGLLRLGLANGQVWEQTSGRRTLVVRPGERVTIMRAALDTFRLSTHEGRVARVRRIR